MSNFFQALITVVIAGFIIAIYYIGKNIFRNLQIKKQAEKVWQKIYVDEKNKFRSYLRFLLTLLTESKIQWIVIWSKIVPEQKLEIIYNTNSGRAEIHLDKTEIGSPVLNGIKSTGSGWKIGREGSFILYCTPNAKILADLIYLVFEQIFNQSRFRNIKIALSGSVESDI